MKIGIAAAVVSVGLIGSSVGFAQMTGQSHPDQVPITTSPEGIQQPVVYQDSPVVPAEVALRPRAGATTPATAPVIVAPAADAKPMMTASVAPIMVDDVKAFARPDVDAGIVTRVPGAANELPRGTVVKVKIREDISTKLTAAGSLFTAELTEPVLRDGRVLLPAGSTLTGHVTEVHGGKRISGGASLHLTTRDVTLPDGTIYALHGQVIDTGLYRQTKVDEEGTIQRRDHKAGTAAAMTLGTGSGAASGALLGGWPGALIGAGVGAGISTVVWLKEDRQADLPMGTRVTFMLTSPVIVGQ